MNSLWSEFSKGIIVLTKPLVNGKWTIEPLQIQKCASFFMVSWLLGLNFASRTCAWYFVSYQRGIWVSSRDLWVCNMGGRRKWTRRNLFLNAGPIQKWTTVRSSMIQSAPGTLQHTHTCWVSNIHTSYCSSIMNIQSGYHFCLSAVDWVGCITKRRYQLFRRLIKKIQETSFVLSNHSNFWPHN